MKTGVPDGPGPGDGGQSTGSWRHLTFEERATT